MTPGQSGTADGIPPLMTLSQAADLLGRSHRTIQKAADSGQMTSMRVGPKTCLVPRSEIDELLDCYSPREFSEVTGWSPAWVYKLMEKGVIRYRRITSLYFIPKAVVSELTEEAPEGSA